MTRSEKFEDITVIARARGEQLRPNAKLIFATGGNYSDNRRYWGYYQRGGTLKLYPADRYTASVTKKPFNISTMLISVRRLPEPPSPDPAEVARIKAAAEAKERREERRTAKARADAEQFKFVFNGG